MKKNNQFESPQRQSEFAIIFIVLRFLRRILRQVWPIFLALALGRRGSSFDLIEMFIAGIGIFGMVTSIIAYFKYYFHLTDSDLVISQGIFKKVKLNIPFERIQSVNFRQTFIHQFFKVTEVEIETAGSVEQETMIDAISIPMAQDLRARILEKKAETTQSESEDNSELIGQTKEVNTILKLAPKELLKVGLAQNHLRPVGLLIGLVGTMIGYSYSFDYSGEFFVKTIYSFFEENFSALMNFKEELPIIYILIGLLVLIVLSVLYSIVTTLLRHYNLHFWRSGNKFQLVQGLLTRKEFAALDNKIQILNWGQNIFERLIGLYKIKFHQAKSSSDAKAKSQFGIPGCHLEQVEFVTTAWLGEESGKFEKYYKISMHYFIRAALYQSIFFGLLSIASIYFSRMDLLLILIPIWFFWVWLTWVSYKKKRYAINDKEFYMGGGIVGFRHAILPLYKVQNVSIVQNPYQWRRNLSTLVVNTAGGKVKVPYIPIKEAIVILDRFTYHVESSKKSWM